MYSDSKQCCKPVVTIEIKSETGDVDVSPYVDTIRKLVDQQWYGSCWYVKIILKRFISFPIV